VRAAGVTRIGVVPDGVNKNMKKIPRVFSRETSLATCTIATMSEPGDSGSSWTLLTRHGHVLVEIANHPDARIRDISAVVGLTERTVQAIVADLEAAGYLTRTRAGRRTQYTVNHDSLFRHSAQEGRRVGPFLTLFGATGEDARTAPESADR
jgi:predicted transcriptional regulator of viral defense system